MPFKTIEEAKDAGFPIKVDGIDLTLPQINKLAEDDKREVKKNSIQYDIKSVPIFMTGRWKGQNSAKGGDVYTEKDFDEMVVAFNEIGKRVKPYMKLGHDDKQKMLQRDGYPAAGWITDLYRKGNELLADISNIPKTIYELIQNKAYGRFSPEIVWNWEDTTSNKKYKRVLTALALLGANTPACDSPNDFINLYGTDILTYSENSDDVKYYETTMKENIMDVKELQEKLEKMETKFNSLTDKLKEKDEKIAELEKTDTELENTKKELAKKEDEHKTELEAKDKELSDRDEKLGEIKLNAKKEEIKNYMDKSVTEGKITPAQKEFYSAVAMIELPEQKHEYSYKTEEDAEKKIEYTCTLDLVKNIIDNSVKSPDFEEKSKKGEVKKNAKGDSKVDDTIDNKVKEYCKTNSMNPDKPDDYSTAYDAVSAEEATKKAESRMEDE